MRLTKKRPLIFIIMSLLLLLISGFPVGQVHAEGSVATKGVIRLYDDATTPSSSNSAEPPISGTTKPAGRTSLPSTGEATTNTVWVSGLIVLLLVLTFSFYRGRKGEA